MPAAPSTAVGGDQLAADQQRASAIAADIASQGHSLDVLAEQYNAAVIAEGQAKAALVAASARAAATDSAVADARRVLAEQALAAYTYAGNDSLSPTTESLTHVDPDLIGAYGEIVSGSEQSTIATLHHLRAQQTADQAALELASQSATATTAALAADRRAAGNAQAALRATLAGVQGQMATLVAAAEAQRAAQAAEVAAQSLARKGAATLTAAAATVATTTTRAPATSATAPSTRPAASNATVRPTTAPAPATAAPAQPSSTTASRAPAASTTTTTAPAPSTPPSGGSVPAQAPGASKALAYARAQIGKPYQWGGAGPDSFDCSGLVMMAWQQAGVGYPHLAQDQYDMTAREPLSAALPGDLIFFGTPDNVYHVGIYVGNGQMIDAPQTGENVQQQSIFWTNLLGAGRVTG